MTFELAETLTKGGAFEKAIQGWQALLEAAVERHGEMEEGTGELYYRYGDALLRKTEESAEVFAGEEDDDLTLAFEVLEVARLVFEKTPSQPRDVAKCKLRLGDLQKLNGNLEQAIGDYEDCLRLRQDLFDAADRRIADVHFALGSAYDYRRNEADCQDKVAAKKKALDHYATCAESLAQRAQNLDPADPEFAELNDIIAELKETIDAAPASDLDALRADQPQTSLGFDAQPKGPVTTLEPKRKATDHDDGGPSRNNKLSKV